MEVAIKTGLLVYAVGPGPKQWRFWCLSPQTKAINPQRWQRESQHEQDINIKKKKKEKRKGESGGDLHLKGEVLMMLWPQCFYSSTAGMHWAQWLVIDQAKPILKNGAIRQKWEGKTREEF